MPRTLPTDGPIDLVQNTRQADITEHWMLAGVVLCGTPIGQWQAASAPGRNRQCKRCARLRDVQARRARHELALRDTPRRGDRNAT